MTSRRCPSGTLWAPAWHKHRLRTGLEPCPRHCDMPNFCLLLPPPAAQQLLRHRALRFAQMRRFGTEKCGCVAVPWPHQKKTCLLFCFSSLYFDLHFLKHTVWGLLPGELLSNPELISCHWPCDFARDLFAETSPDLPAGLVVEHLRWLLSSRNDIGTLIFHRQKTFSILLKNRCE